MSNDTHFLNPKPTQDMFTLPVGYIDDSGALHTSVTVREMTGIEEEILVGDGMLDARLSRLIANCIVDLGGVAGSVDMVKSMVTADRMFLLFAIRRVSLGDRYSVLVNCPECSSEFRSEVDLSSMEMASLDDPMVRKFSGELPSGIPFEWHILTGEDEAWQFDASKMLKGEGSATLTLMARLDRIGGVSVERTTSRQSLKRMVLTIARLGWKDRMHLRSEFTRIEGNSDTKMEFECSCGHCFSADFALDPKSFFFPSEI